MSSDQLDASDQPTARRCPWNLSHDSKRDCYWEGEKVPGICENCEEQRSLWLTKLLALDKSGFTRRQLLSILNRQKTYEGCIQIIRTMNQNRIIDHVTSPAHEPETTNIIPIPDKKMSAASLGSAKPVATSTMSVIPEAIRYLAEGVGSARLATAPGPAIFDSDSVQPDRSVTAPEEGFPFTSGTRRVGGMTEAEWDAEEEQTRRFEQRRAQRLEEKRLRSQMARTQSRAAAAARKASDLKKITRRSTPSNFVVFPEATRTPSRCKEMEPNTVTWDESEFVSCWKCGRDTLARAENVMPQVIGDKDHLYRALPLPGYGCVVTVPCLQCAGKPQCQVGFLRTICAVRWDGRWEPLPHFLREEIAGDAWREVPSELCRDRAVLQMLHWFSKTREAREDDHAGLPPPALDRGAALVFRGGEAAGYATFCDQLVEDESGWQLPALYNIFVRSQFRARGCARQLLCSFFRPASIGKRRTRRVSLSGGTDNTQGDGIGTVQSMEVEVPPGIDESGLSYLDLMQIDPPVSAALVTCMARVLTAKELENIVCDSGPLQCGAVTYQIDPVAPKTRVFSPAAQGYVPFPRGKGERVVIGGLVPLQSSEFATKLIGSAVPVKAQS